MTFDLIHEYGGLPYTRGRGGVGAPREGLQTVPASEREVSELSEVPASFYSPHFLPPLFSYVLFHTSSPPLPPPPPTPSPPLFPSFCSSLPYSLFLSAVYNFGLITVTYTVYGVLYLELKSLYIIIYVEQSIILIVVIIILLLSVLLLSLLLLLLSLLLLSSQTKRKK